MAQPIMNELIDHGKVVRGYLGVGIQDLDAELQQALGLNGVEGVLISSVEPGGAAQRAGIQRGDVITSVDGVPTDTTGRLRNAIAAKGAGKSVQLELRRGGTAKQLTVELGALPDAAIPTEGKGPQPSSGLGVELSPLTAELAQRFGIERKQGVVVVRVVPGSPAASAGLLPGDVLLELDKKKLNAPGDVKAALAAGKGPVLLLVERGGRTRYVAVKR